MQNPVRFTVAVMRQVIAYCSFYRDHGDAQILLSAIMFLLLGIPAAIILDLILLPHRMMPRKGAAAGPKSGERRLGA